MTYHYLNTFGIPVYCCVRYPGKKFRWFKYGSGGERVPGIDGVLPFPYNLPQIIKNPEVPAYFVEGEKDADNLNRRSLIAMNLKPFKVEKNIRNSLGILKIGP